LLIASLVKNMAWIDHFIAIDTSLRAINCSYRASAQQRTFKAQGIGEIKGSYICGRFHPDYLGMQFDVILCNPPYIPVPPSLQFRVERHVFSTKAVGGTELLTLVLQSLPK